MASDRLVLGGIDDRTHAVLEELYRSFPTSVPRLRTDTRTARDDQVHVELIARATMISFANEIGNLCAAVGVVDVAEVMQGVHLSHYLSPFAPDGSRVRAPIASFLEAGCGFGGSCLPKDVRALIAEGERRQQPMHVLRAVIKTNEEQLRKLVQIVESAVDTLQSKRITVLGLAFKPDTDDVRETPTVPIVQRLVARGARSQSTIRWCLLSRNSSRSGHRLVLRP